MTLGQLVARRLREIRRERRLSQEELAARAGINRNYVGKIERGENSPTVEMLEKLAVVLGVEPELLFRDGKSDNRRQNASHDA